MLSYNDRNFISDSRLAFDVMHTAAYHLPFRTLEKKFAIYGSALDLHAQKYSKLRLAWRADS